MARIPRAYGHALRVVTHLLGHRACCVLPAAGVAAFGLARAAGQGHWRDGALQEELKELRERERLARGRSNLSKDERQAVVSENHELRSELSETKVRVEDLAQMVRDVLAKLTVA